MTLKEKNLRVNSSVTEPRPRMCFAVGNNNSGSAPSALRLRPRPTLSLVIVTLVLAAVTAGTAMSKSKRVDAPSHWAFLPVRQPTVPVAANHEWVRNPIDAFLAAAHEKHGLVPSNQRRPRCSCGGSIWI